MLVQEREKVVADTLAARAVIASALPFDFGRSLDFLGGFAPCAGDQLVGERSVTRAARLGGGRAVLRVSAGGEPGELDVEVFTADGGPRDAVVEAVRAVRQWLGLDDDLAAFYRIAEDDAAFAPVVGRLHGLRHVRFFSLAEIAAWAVLTQRTPARIALRHKAELQARYGDSVVHAGRALPVFPSLEALAAAPVDELVGVVGNSRRGEYLHNVAAALLDLDEEWLRSAPYADAFAALRGIRGAGEWTASAILLRGLGRMEFVPSQMRQFTEPARRLYGPDVDVAAVVARYGRHAGYWAYYLRNAVG